VAEPTWNGNKVHGEITNWEQPPTSPIAKIRTVEDNSWGGSVGPSAIEILSEEDDAHVVDDTQPQIESLTADAAHNDPTELAQEGPDDQDESNESPQTILVEPLNQEGLHYTVSEVMTDDGHSTVPPDERDADVVSVADGHSGGLVPYIVEEPVSEGRQTEVSLRLRRRLLPHIWCTLVVGTSRASRDGWGTSGCYYGFTKGVRRR
jgi:hypothetical protein